MASTAANGITIEYETSGDPSNPPLLLVMGLGAQLLAWDDRLVDKLADRGFWVIRYDNRDVGLSTWFDDAGMPDLAGLFTGDVQAPYLMSDMAADAAGLLDALGVARAHVVGVSMGGMIAQAFAIDYPDRTLSLVSVMSNTGNPAVGQPHPAALEVLLSPAPTSRDAVVEQSVQSWKVIGSPGFDFDEPLIRRQAAAAFDRAFHPDGTVRQLVAIVASPDRTPRLKTLRIPTLVIHGADDPLVDVSGGRATAEAIPGARLEIIEGMGHDLPVELFDRFADMILENATVEHA